jgi:uncharacterized cupin superfamily protein
MGGFLMSKSPILIDAFAPGLESAAIPPSWILDGAPQTRSKNMARSHDWMSHLVVWECTGPARFTWNYTSDEVLFVISGEAYVSKDGAEEQRLGPGDVVYLPAGTICTWRVPESIRKVAIMRETTWRPLGFSLKVVNKLLRVAGLKGESALMLVVAISLRYIR